MSRPRQGEVRDQRVNVRLTVTEFVAVRERAFRAGRSVSDYVREAALGVPSSAGRRDDGPLFAVEPASFHQIRLLGANLNQIARRLNAQNLPASPELAPLLADIRATLQQALSRHGAEYQDR